MTTGEGKAWHAGGENQKVSSFDRQSLRLIAAGVLEARKMHAAGRNTETIKRLFDLITTQRGEIFRGINDVHVIQEGYLAKPYTRAFFMGIAALQVTTDPQEILARLRAHQIPEEVLQELERIFDMDLPGWRPSGAGAHS